MMIPISTSGNLYQNIIGHGNEYQVLFVFVLFATNLVPDEEVSDLLP